MKLINTKGMRLMIANICVKTLMSKASCFSFLVLKMLLVIYFTMLLFLRIVMVVAKVTTSHF